MEAQSNLLVTRKPGSYFLPGLKHVREERGYSIRELAEKTGLSPDTIWRVETQKRGAEAKTRRRLARALHVSIKELQTPEEEATHAS